MKTRKLIPLIAAFLVFTMVLFAFPVYSFAAGDGSDIIPSAKEISENTNYSEGLSSSGRSSAKSTVSGGCSITRLSSTSVNIAGYSFCESSDPAIKVSLTLQAYYSGSWHNLATKVKSQSGTRVDLSQAYTVTSGYYYRVSAFHSLADGTSCTSRTNSIWVG